MAKKVTNTIPIVMTTSTDPVGTELLTASLDPAKTSRRCPTWARSWAEKF